MFDRQFRQRFSLIEDHVSKPNSLPANPASPFVTLIGLSDIYDAASSRARRDFELDKLFNPDYYGDYGSGI